MIFSETILPTGTKVYKGQRVGCTLVPGTTKNFFVTLSPRAAKEYGQPCFFFARHKLRLFQMTPGNILQLLKYPGLSRWTQMLIRIVFGIGTVQSRQAKAYKQLFQKSLSVAPTGRTGQRLSVYTLDKLLAEKLTKEFFRPEKYDGYYAPSMPSVFHHGRFHSEIMLCDGTKSLQKPAADRAVRPHFDQRRILKMMPELFIQYCKKYKRLVAPNKNFSEVYLGGGMAVKLYLRARGKKIPNVVRNTSDFDFTYAVNKPLSNPKRHVAVMKRLMSEHVANFLAQVNRIWNIKQMRLVIKDDFIPDIQLLPATKKYVYQVISYQLAFPGQEPVDFIDTTLAYVPGSSRSQLQMNYSRYYGIPLKSVKYMFKDVAVVLAGSFLFPGIEPRNPLRGRRSEKGIKDAARLAILSDVMRVRTVNRPFVNASRGLLRKIAAENYTASREKAKNVIRYLRSK
jgi:hypothetical protein